MEIILNYMHCSTNEAIRVRKFYVLLRSAGDGVGQCILIVV